MFSKKGADESWKEKYPFHHIINLKNDHVGSFGTGHIRLGGVIPKLDP